MRDEPVWSSGSASRLRVRRRLPAFYRFAIPTVFLGLGVLAGASMWNHRAPVLPAASQTPVPIATTRLTDTLLDSRLSLGHRPRPFGQSAPMASEWRAATAATSSPVTSSPIILPPAPSQIIASLPPLPAARPADPFKLVEDAPLPVPRPSGLRASTDLAERPNLSERARPAAPDASPRRRKEAAAQVAPADNRSFFDKLFGVTREPGTALAYAAPQDDVVDASRGRRLSPSLAPTIASARTTAVYDIAARTVTMPNGERLEAHSGLGDKMDDPRFVHVRMKGATPPHVYNLTEREALFHGVRALRLNPVGGSGAIHGRAGLLTHTYLLGPNGDSNGCVSFKDYDKFLQAFLRGEVKRLVVVASSG